MDFGPRDMGDCWQIRTSLRLAVDFLEELVYPLDGGGACGVVGAVNLLELPESATCHLAAPRSRLSELLRLLGALPVLEILLET